MDIDQKFVDLAEHLTWPFVALIALFVLRKNFVELAKGASNLKEVLGKGGDVITLMQRVKELKDEASNIKEMLEAISIKDKSKELADLTAQVDVDGSLSVEDMFNQIEGAWQEVKTIIKQKSDSVGIKGNVMGTKGVSSTVEELSNKGAITKRAAELATAVSSKYQWMYRTSSPKEEWLKFDVFESFMKAANEAKAALERITV